MLTPWKESYDQPRQHIKKQRHYFVNKGLSSQGYGFPSSHVWIRVGLQRNLSAKELMLLNCGVGEDSWESLGQQGDLSNSSWRRSVLGVHWKDWCWSWNPNILPPDVKSWLIWKDPDAGKDWGQEEKETTENEMVRWHHRLNGHEFEQAPGDGERQGSLACCSPQGRKELDTTERLNNNH